MIDIVKSLQSKGAQAVILGCTEPPMLLNGDNSPLPLLDSEELLIQAALETAL
ncbi:hypothetical protein CVV65_13035 [Kyrpidia spormannii]|uniref:Aspartate racemase n=1 Tax=Kyrpidia spormannii TaxID=2055160 RepID=A0A2K8N9F3_9BACL|nr:hypothetical protein CVV65_13035 [Kyrpidia spormannii]